MDPLCRGAGTPGHRIAVLHKVYAEALDRMRERANARIDAALRKWSDPE
ncbi:hypothetical protein GCM10018793_28720 [Streptomyces sulfonofaciens]|uniref:Uncharacterized protein n=1 Tax=Streptomyces sulfonofaciens TaxID=68272 RepID=A0A919G5Z7_9ACTN|nr:hypothetical protein GCM10018793_28720 [Streptomyces sulfonofaciens]